MKTKLILVYLSFIVLHILFSKPPKEVQLGLSNLPAFQKFSNPLGCDKLGRDILSLYTYGTLSAILFSIPARIFCLISVIFLNLLVFSLGRVAEVFMNGLSAVFISIPSFLLGLILVYSLGQSLFTFFIAIFFIDWATIYETYQAKVSEIKLSNYVLASKLMGATKFFIFKKHILFEIFSLSKVLLITGIPSVIMTIAIFNFLGIDFGSDIFGPSLGEQISFSKDFFDSSYLSLISPILGILILLLLLS